MFSLRRLLPNNGVRFWNLSRRTFSQKVNTKPRVTMELSLLRMYGHYFWYFAAAGLTAYFCLRNMYYVRKILRNIDDIFENENIKQIAYLKPERKSKSKLP